MRRHAQIALAAACLGAGLAVAPVAESREPDPDEPREPKPEPVLGPNGIPDRVSLEGNSPYFFADWRKIGVRIDGGESQSVVEFCVSEGWARTQIYHGGRPKMERGRFVTVTRRGVIEPYWRSRT